MVLVSKHLWCKIGPCGAEAVTISKHENHGEELIDLAGKISGYATSRSSTCKAHGVNCHLDHEVKIVKRGRSAVFRFPTVPVNLKQKNVSGTQCYYLIQFATFGGLTVVWLRGGKCFLVWISACGWSGVCVSVTDGEFQPLSIYCMLRWYPNM